MWILDNIDLFLITFFPPTICCLQLQAVKSRDCCEAGIISLKKETEGSWSNGSDNNSDLNLDPSRALGLNSPISSHNIKNLLPNSLKPNSITQLLQDDGLCNMFHNIDAPQNFWPRPDQHHPRFHWPYISDFWILINDMIWGQIIQYNLFYSVFFSDLFMCSRLVYKVWAN